MKRFVCLLLCAAALCVLACPPAARAAPESNPVLRVGLAYGAGAMISANLENYIGGGYEFGYLDAESRFVPLGCTAQTKITMVKNRNVYLSGGTYGGTPEGDVVGAYHNGHGSYPSRADAEAAVGAFRAQGVPAFVSYRNGAWLARSSSFADSGGGARETGSKYCVSVVVTGTVDIIFQFDCDQTYSLCVRPCAPDGVRAVTWHRQRRYAGMFEFRRFEGDDLYVYNALDMQDYVKGVIPYEMSPSWPLEALKAQAVCARSYAVSSMTRHRGEGFNLCTGEHCQVYYGAAQASETSDRAVDETFGQYLTHNGQPCNAVYHASDGGATEDSENVWTNVIPYLRGVPDPYEDASQIPGYQWQYTFTNAQLSDYLNRNGRANAGVSGFYVDQYTGMGNVLSVTFTDTAGKVIASYSKEAARTLIRGLSGSSNALSQRYGIASGEAALTAVSTGGAILTHSDLSRLYAIDGQGNIAPLPPAAAVTLISSGGLYALPVQSGPSSSGVYTVTGRGHGHNVGMSQWGARGMAEQGFSYDRILGHYFTGAEITG
ncbi:MAG: SpoIID/LytB domain-containing protein [Oscillospiraceae bacterium]|jgi:stage II sporulation protein D|nr:SpoIID/LytB domain-containing protein [Oscillospiraceae bacterium]